MNENPDSSSQVGLRERRQIAFRTKAFPPIGNKSDAFLQYEDFEFQEAPTGTDPGRFQRPSDSILIFDQTKKEKILVRDQLVAEVPRLEDFDFGRWRRSDRMMKRLLGICIVSSIVWIGLPKDDPFFNAVSVGVEGAIWFLAYLFAIVPYRTITKFYGEQAMAYLLSYGRSEFPSWVTARVVGILYHIYAHETPMRMFPRLEPFMATESEGRHTRPNSREWMLSQFRRFGLKLFEQSCDVDDQSFKNYVIKVQFDQLYSFIEKYDKKFIHRWEQRPRLIFSVLQWAGTLGAIIAFSALMVVLGLLRAQGKVVELF